MATRTLRTRPWSPGVYRGNTPVIAHPMSQMGSCGDLSVRGVSTPVLRREKTISFVDNGRVDSVSKDNKFCFNGGYSPRLLHWPLDYQQQQYVGRPAVRQKESPNFKGKSEDELLDKVRDKLTTGFYGLRHMFKANDPMGKGNVTKEALLRILYHLCGYITKEQFDRFLRRLDLDDNNLISFVDFVKCFQDNETVRRQWVIPTKKMETQEFRRAMYPEENLRDLENMQCDPHHSAPYAAAFLRDKLNTGESNIRDLLPTACFEPNGMVLAPQLREAMAQLGIYFTNSEYDKFWSRFDRDNCGAVYTKQLYKQIGLTSLGQPKITSTAITTSNSHKNSSHQSHKSEIVTCWSSEEKDGVRHDTLRTSYNYDVEDENVDEKQETKVKHQRTNDSKDRKASRRTNVVSKPPVPPTSEKSSVTVSRKQKTTQQTATKFENVLDSLHSKYEGPYTFMLEAFQLFDYLDDGYISKVDFRRVMKEFGITIAALELEEFLRSCGIRTIQGQINYKDFLVKYQNREKTGILNGTSGNNNKIIRQETKSEVKNTTKSEHLESAVVEHLHGDFIKLVSDFKEADVNNEGKVSEETFRNVIENQLGGTLTDKQWKVLQKDVGAQENGAISYPGFLAKFDIQPGTWNQQLHGETILPKHTIHKIDDPTMEKLRHMASYMMSVKDKEETDERTRLVLETNRQIEDIFRSRFHTFDKHFKDMDRKMTGRMTKWQFGALLRLTGLTLNQKELDRLWSTLSLARDGMLAYSALIKQFSPANRVRSVWGKAPSFDENTQSMVERARQIQRERKEGFRLRPHSAPNTGRPRSAKASAPLNLKTDTSKLLRRKEIMKKLQPFVAKNWDRLHQSFINLDRQGFSNIGYMEMRGLMTQLQFGLNNTDMGEIIDQFDLEGNGRFHYIAFLEAFGPQGGNFDMFEEVNEMSPNFVGKQSCDVTETKGSFAIPTAVYTMRTKLLREWQNLRRAFRKMDSNNDGYLEVGDFKKCLKLCNIDGSDEDLYHLFSQFDRELTGKIAYREFLKTLLSVK
ncbi:uncharacterized protein LOC126811060 isoform X2 [Patella vulgata]|uniref:uncharacterized protein LOC126811060 isoform X2 n=1 Tax=Patella vulgata TaxID=6465 RepID=UPI00218064CB|nr:uncharacterized protein LOC126811060 isoform X2 [Patella vulgata]